MAILRDAVARDKRRRRIERLIAWLECEYRELDEAEVPPGPWTRECACCSWPSESELCGNCMERMAKGA